MKTDQSPNIIWDRLLELEETVWDKKIMKM